MDKHEILVIYGTEYRAMTRRILEEADLASMIGSREKRIGIKPNLVSPVPACEGATTHPELAEELICYLQEHGFHKLVMMEGSWVGARTADAVRVCGYDRLCQRYGVEWIDTQKEPSVPADCGGLALKLCRCVREVDFLINLPVLKGHCQTHVTCALKNMKGLIPNSEKRRFHTMGLHRPIAHLNLGIRQDFILVDSICGDLSFEDGGNPSDMNRIFAAADPVLCDAYGCRLMGYETREVEYIDLAEQLGVGSADLKSARIRELSDPVPAREGTPDHAKLLRLSDAADAVDSCSACYGYLMPALDMLDREGLLEDFPEKICIGQGYRGKTGTLGVGNCTSGFAHSLKGCPPTEIEMYEFLKEYVKSRRADTAGKRGGA